MTGWWFLEAFLRFWSSSWKFWAYIGRRRRASSNQRPSSPFHTWHFLWRQSQSFKKGAGCILLHNKQGQESSKLSFGGNSNIESFACRKWKVSTLPCWTAFPSSYLAISSILQQTQEALKAVILVLVLLVFCDGDIRDRMLHVDKTREWQAG